MQRLDFVLDDFTRIAYASKAMEDLWKPRITKISNRIRQLEIESVNRNLRKAALVNLSADELKDNANELNQKSCVPLSLAPDVGMYSSNAQQYVKGLPFTYRTLICDPNILPEFFESWVNNDNRVIGELLDYPKCCIDFFQKTWPGKVDTTYEMGEFAKEVTFKGYSPWCNVLLRYIGCRIVFHLPCSFVCMATHDLGLRYFKIFHDAYPKEARWLEEMLKWPLKWSALHGVAEITTPAFKIMTRTDAWSDEAVIELAGIDGITELPDLSGPRVDSWSSNGFTSKQGMKSAHDSVMLALMGSPKPTRVIDLGCGAGDLLSRFGGALKVGVESDYNRFMEGIEYNPEVIFFHMDILNFCKNVWTEPTELTIIGGNRIREYAHQTSSDALHLILKTIKAKSDYLLVTQYNDPTHVYARDDWFQLLSGTEQARLYKCIK